MTDADEQRLERLRDTVNSIGMINVAFRPAAERDKIAFEYRKAQLDYLKALNEIAGRGL